MAPATTLTPRQAECLAFLRRYVRQNDGVAPSLAEIAQGLGLRAKSNVHALLRALEDRGAIERDSYRHRSLRIVERNRNMGAGDE